MTIIITTGILVLLLIMLVYAATKPDVYPIERSILMKAEPERIFDLINNMSAWEAWTPYDKGTDIVKSYHGPSSGEGATVSWDSKGKAGKGSMEITHSFRPVYVDIKLTMIKPFQVVNKVEFLIEPKQHEETKVTWRMQHTEPYPAKVIGIFINMDKMVGRDFEIGLDRLKRTVESETVIMKD